MLRRSLPACLGLLGILLLPQAQASISLSATRIIFDGAHPEANITVRNGNQNVLIQSWIDAETPSETTLPFAVTPPLTRIFAKQQQLLRILYEGQGMPADKESVVWLNVQEIPQAAAQANTLQLAVRQRIKVFFRPAGLTGDPLQAPAQLQWQLSREDGKALLNVSNPSRYHVSMADVMLKSSTKTETLTEGVMIAPGQAKSFPLPVLASDKAPTLSFISINDYGAQTRYSAVISSDQAHTAKVAEGSSAP
ncbi:molecular chaperone [Pseudomonas sp. NPDC087346]|uniref:fimbrial biogenesis chaperone n=1 Tax=Pseudomonas sp. NPDC087346 TaxID=3364438 RepID=UPI0037F77A3C